MTRRYLTGSEPLCRVTCNVAAVLIVGSAMTACSATMGPAKATAPDDPIGASVDDLSPDSPAEQRLQPPPAPISGADTSPTGSEPSTAEQGPFGVPRPAVFSAAESDANGASPASTPPSSVSATSASQDTSSVLRGNLVFAPGSKQVERNETNEAVLQQIAATLHDTPEIQLLRIEGHTDDRGKPAANLELSGERALAIKHRLVAHGVSPTRLVAVGFGASRPIADNRSRAGRAQNRRTELHVINASAPNPSSDTRLNGGTEFR